MNMKEENLVSIVSLRISAPMKMGVDQVEKIKKVSLEEGKHALDQTTAESH